MSRFLFVTFITLMMLAFSASDKLGGAPPSTQSPTPSPGAAASGTPPRPLVAPITPEKFEAHMRETVKNGLKLADASALLASSLPAFIGTDPTKFSDSAEIVTILNNFQRDLGAWIGSMSSLVPALAELKETLDRLPASSLVAPGATPPRPGLIAAGKLWRGPEWFRAPKAYALETPLEHRVEYADQSIGYDDALSAILTEKGHLTEAQKVNDCYAEMERRVAASMVRGRSRLDVVPILSWT
ncbi:MAG: hypothetical protein EXR47_08695 [Dehalococcoidia bacterium]|nr:hypothetical protein [Dehalococcoidia bacterium]